MLLNDRAPVKNRLSGGSGRISVDILKKLATKPEQKEVRIRNGYAKRR
jgi:hypothetical protein